MKAADTLKDYKKISSKKQVYDGLISKSEFGVLLEYMLFFGEAWVAFEEIDANTDGRLSLAEFATGCVKLGLIADESEAAEVFRQVDSNDGGFVRGVLQLGGRACSDVT